MLGVAYVIGRGPQPLGVMHQGTSFILGSPHNIIRHQPGCGQVRPQALRPSCLLHHVHAARGGRCAPTSSWAASWSSSSLPTSSSFPAHRKPWSSGPVPTCPHCRPPPDPAARAPAGPGEAALASKSPLALRKARPLAHPHGPLDAGHAGQALSLQLVPSWVPGPEAAFVPAQGRLSSSPAP